MARYKVLKGVAHNFGHSFISLENYFDTDYVMGYLLTAARQSGLEELRVDILNKKWEPKDLATRPIVDSLTHYCNWFPKLVEQSGTSMDVIAQAHMTIRFDLAKARPASALSKLMENPFVCEVTITDSRGKAYSARFADWWYPES